uniref:ERI1 exoribonuclease family member 3 n=1 Tax=Ovis aries TaxID=9940 RepID=A0AC11DNH6_SHEEP
MAFVCCQLLQEVRPARLPHCSLPLDALCLSGVRRLHWRVDEWMAKEGLLDPNVKSIFVTCGDWDLKVMLPGQCQYLGLPVADYFKQWINLKKAYSFAMGCWPKNGLLDMNKGLSLQHIGRPHSGIDDCKNIANIMKTLAYRGFIFKQTSKPF